MNYRAEINVMPLKALLDPQGKAVKSGLENLGLSGVEDVRIGKHITVFINAASKEEAAAMTEEACKKLLANAIMESYDFEIVEVA